MKPTVLPLSDDGLTAGCTPGAFNSVGEWRRRRIILLPFLRTPFAELKLPLRRLKIDAGADCSFNRLGLAAHPRWYDRAKSASGSTGRNHKQMVRRLKRGVNFVG